MNTLVLLFKFMKSQGVLAEEKSLKVLRLIWSRKYISRVEIANELGMDKSTITKIVNELKSVNIIRETTQGTSGPQGGRRPVFLEITPDFACSGGIEFNPEGIVYCLINLQGQIVFQENENCLNRPFDKDKIENIIFEACVYLQNKAKELKLNLIGIGLGFPALLNSKKSEIIYSLPLMINEPLNISSLSSKLNLPIQIENDARCCCYSEIVHGILGRSNFDVKNMLFVLTEYRAFNPILKSQKNLAVGMGIVLNSQILKGPDDSAGEFRSMLWEEGRAGQFFSGEGNLSSIISDNDEIHSIFYELAQHIAFLVNTLNLSTVCIGGMESEYISILENYIKERIKLQWSYNNERHIKVKMAAYGEQTVAHGAACMILTKMFSFSVLHDNSGEQVSILNLF